MYDLHTKKKLSNIQRAQALTFGYVTLPSARDMIITIHGFHVIVFVSIIFKYHTAKSPSLS
jgi:hypothetical protein